MALLKRCSGGDPARAAVLLGQARQVLARLPAPGIPLAHLAAEVLGDSHALDAGQPTAAIVLRACRRVLDRDGYSRLDELAEASNAGTEREDVEERNRSVREQWALLGVTVNELAAPALCLNLPVEPGTPTADVLLAAARHGEPVHLTLRALLRHASTWSVANRDVFVCENPSIVAHAADRLGTSCAPIVCTDGMPSAAQRTLLRQLTAAGARLRYHGDFDWPGLRIGNYVIRELGALPWRFSTADYLAANAVSGPVLKREERVPAMWDEQLADAMLECGFAVHEERVFEALLSELKPCCQVHPPMTR
jgi:uncharacterized protein (TIGR02679 family)